MHWVAHKTREIVCNVKPIAIGGTEEKVVAHKVVDGEVEPNVAFATNALIDPVHPFLLDGVHHAIARPHHLDARTKMLSQSVEVNVALAAPSTVVDGGAEQKWRNITVFSHKRRVNIVEQFRLFFCTRTFARNIVKENSERTDAKPIHLLEFIHEIVAVFVRPFDVKSWVNSPVEIHTALVSTNIEFLEQFCLLFRVCFAPMLTVIRVIFRSIDVNIHLVATIEVNLSQAVFVTPRTSVETFDRTAKFHIRPVLDGASFELSFRHHIAQSLHTIIESALIATRNDHSLRPHSHIVTFRLLRYEFLKLIDAAVAHHTEGDAERRRLCRFFHIEVRESRHGIGTLSLTIGSH